MNLTIVASMGARHQILHAHAMREGLRAHGIRAGIVHNHNSVQTDVVACWGWRTGALHQQSGRRVLVMERGYIGDRFAWTSLGWDGLNGRARFADKTDNGERFGAYFPSLMQPWRTGGEYVLIVGQVPGDAALSGRCLRAWYAEMAAGCARLYGLPVHFRPHPLAARRGGTAPVDGAETMTGDLSAALAGAALVVTYNSNTAVESILAGRPTVAANAGSMASGLALSALPASLDVPEPDRAPWAHRLAWKQYTLDEIESGQAWAIVGSACRG